MSQMGTHGFLGPADPSLVTLIVPEVWVMENSSEIGVENAGLGRRSAFTSHLMLGKSNSVSVSLLMYKLELIVLVYLTLVFLKFYLFIFGCIGSSLLRAGFL